MGEEPNAASIEPRAVHIDFPYYYRVDGIQRTGRVTCDVDKGELDKTSSTSLSLDSRIVR